MKKIIVGSLIGLLLMSIMMFARDGDNNTSKDFNKTKEILDNNISKSLMVNLDKLKKKNGLKSPKSEPVVGTILISDNKDEVSIKGWDNDEVSNKGICFNGTKRTLYHGVFITRIKKEGKSIFEDTYKSKNICISTVEIKKGDTLEVINSRNKLLAEFTIEKN